MKKTSALYYFSWALILIILFTALFGAMLKPHGISEADKLQGMKERIDGVDKYTPAPLPPSSTFVLGTDHRGFDLASLLLNGLKYTLILVLLLTLLRLLFAVPWGLWVGTTGKSKEILRSTHWVFSAVPAVLLLYPPLAAVYFGLGLNAGAKADPHYLQLFNILYLALVTVLGVIPLAAQVAERARFYNDKQYVEVSRVMGGTIFHRILRHLVPNMRLELLFMSLSELVHVIFLVGQLAVFGIIPAGSEFMELDDFGLSATVTSTGEWVAMLSYGIEYVRLYPWIPLTTIACVSFLTLSIQLFLSQLKKRFSGVAESK